MSMHFASSSRRRFCASSTDYIHLAQNAQNSKFLRVLYFWLCIFFTKITSNFLYTFPYAYASDYTKRSEKPLCFSKITNVRANFDIHSRALYETCAKALPTSPNVLIDKAVQYCWKTVPNLSLAFSRKNTVWRFCHTVFLIIMHYSKSSTLIMRIRVRRLRIAEEIVSISSASSGLMPTCSGRYLQLQPL